MLAAPSGLYPHDTHRRIQALQCGAIPRSPCRHRRRARAPSRPPGQSSWISRPMVPCPAMIQGWSKGGTTVSPSASAIARARAHAAWRWSPPSRPPLPAARSRGPSHAARSWASPPPPARRGAVRPAPAPDRGSGGVGDHPSGGSSGASCRRKFMAPQGLEGSRALEALALEPHLVPRALRQGRAGEQGGLYQDAKEAVGGGTHLVQGDQPVRPRGAGPGPCARTDGTAAPLTRCPLPRHPDPRPVHRPEPRSRTPAAPAGAHRRGLGHDACDVHHRVALVEVHESHALSGAPDHPDVADGLPVHHSAAGDDHELLAVAHGLDRDHPVRSSRSRAG